MDSISPHLYAIRLFNTGGLVRQVLIDPDTLTDPDDPYAELERLFPDFFDATFCACEIVSDLDRSIEFRTQGRTVSIEGPFENYGVIRIQGMVERYLDARRT